MDDVLEVDNEMKNVYMDCKKEFSMLYDRLKMKYPENIVEKALKDV